MKTLSDGLHLLSEQDDLTDHGLDLSDDFFQNQALRLTVLISLLSRGLSGVFSKTTVQKHQFFAAQPSLRVNSYLYMTAGKTIALTRWTFVD